MEADLGLMLEQLHQELGQNVMQVNDMSTMARVGNNALVTAFFSENVMLKLQNHSQTGDQLSTPADVLQNYIYTCCFWGCRDILKKILDIVDHYHLNVNLNAKNQKTMWTPLHAAAFQEHGPVVMLLLEHGADPTAADAAGWTPIDFASVSDRIWPLFAARGLQRVPPQLLLDNGLILRLPEHRSRITSAAANIPLADYDGASSVSSFSSQSSAAVNGDVLADDGDTMSSPHAVNGQRSVKNGYRFVNNIY